MVEALTEGEFVKLIELAGKTTPLPVVRVEPSSLSRVYHVDLLEGLGYVMLDVGMPMVPQPKETLTHDSLLRLFSSLSIVHRCGQIHGDARIRNAVILSDMQVVWVDVAWSGSEPVGENGNIRKRADMETLIDSIFEESWKENTELKQFLDEYADSLDNVDRMVQLLSSLKQRPLM